MIKNAIINSIWRKKEIGNLNASNSDTLTRSQSLNKKVILNSLNSQECALNHVKSNRKKSGESSKNLTQNRSLMRAEKWDWI